LVGDHSPTDQPLGASFLPPALSAPPAGFAGRPLEGARPLPPFFVRSDQSPAGPTPAEWPVFAEADDADSPMLELVELAEEPTDDRIDGVPDPGAAPFAVEAPPEAPFPGEALFPREPDDYNAAAAPYEPETATDPAAALRAVDLQALPTLPAADDTVSGLEGSADAFDELPPLPDAEGHDEREEPPVADLFDADADADAFPIDAFIIPDDGEDTSTLISSDGVARLAERIGGLAADLRENGASALQHRLHHGDRLDAILAALLVGYVAGEEQGQ
jgi:hypothetical protein